MRADVYLCAKGYYKSRNKAGEAIKREEVFLNGKLLKMASQEVLSGDEIEIKAEISKMGISAFELFGFLI